MLICFFLRGSETNPLQTRDILLHDFEQGYCSWQVSGNAFGLEPAKGNIGLQRGVRGYEGQRLVNSYRESDRPTGRLLSPAFCIRRDYLSFLVGGGHHVRQTCVNLCVAGEVVHSTTGRNSETLRPVVWDVRKYRDQKARIEVVDDVSGKWGHILADHFLLTTRSEPCSVDSIAKATTAVRAAVPKALEDPNRPVYHFRPPAQWMNDINGSMYYNGYYHIFYQHNPYADTWGSMHWGHARSRDLVHWEHQPIALWPSYERGEEHCYSGGCGIRPEDGLPMLFYTSIGHEYREEWAAISDDDMVTWKKVPSNPVVAHTTSSGTRFSAQDPFVFEYEGKTWLLSTSFNGKNNIGGLHLYETMDGTLTKWHYCGRLTDHTSPCPNLVPIGRRWVLLLHTRWYVGTVDWENHRFMTEEQGPLVYSADRNARGSNVITNGPQQRPLFMAWISRRVHYDETGRGWAGCMSLPTEMFIRADGGLGYRPVTELNHLRGAQCVRPAFTVSDGTVDLPELAGHTREIIVEFIPPSTGECGVRLRCRADGDSAVVLRYNSNGHLHVEGHGEQTTVVPIDLRPDGSIKLQIFLDRAVMEYFVNDGERYGVQYVHNSIEDTGTALFSEGTMKVTHLTSWERLPIW